jgi:glycine cleavage system H protein
MNVPGDLLYTAEHEWVRIEGDVATVGITEYAQDALGDVVFVELPKVGRSFEKGEVFGVVESVKTTSDLFSPLSGTVEEVNAEVQSETSLVNTDCYGAAWMIRMRVRDAAELGSLMSPEAYSQHLQDGAGH